MLLLLIACGPADPYARAYTVESLDQVIGGPKATIGVGDIVLENDRVRIGIVGERYSLGPSPYGGTIADADIQRPDPRYGAGHGRDAMGEMFATVNMNLIAADTEGEVTIVEAGGDNASATVRADGEAEPFLSLLDALWAIVGQPTYRVTTDYTLDPGSPALKITTTASFTTPGGELPASEPAEGKTGDFPLLDFALFTGFSFGDFYLQGGSVDVFTPGYGFDEDSRVYEAMSSGKNTFQEPFEVPFVAGVADGVSYAVATAGGNLYVPLFTSSQTAIFGAGVEGDPCDEDDETECEPDRFPATAAYRYERHLAVGRGDVGSALDGLIEALGWPHGEVRGHVVEAGTGVALSGASVLLYRKVGDSYEPYAYNQWLSDVGDDTQIDGSFGGMVPPGEYEIQVHKRGRPVGQRVPITVTEGATLAITLESPRPGSADLHVVDESGRPVPAKVTIYPDAGGATLQPDLGDPFIADAPSEVLFLPYGEATVVLPPGSYRAVASRGTEYELGPSQIFTVKADGVAEVDMQIVRSVVSDGWVTADFHVHARNSFDSGTQLTDRVITMVCEGIEFFTSSDHDNITDYEPVVEDLDLEPWVKTGIGLETTTLEVGHFIGFPLENDTLSIGGGAFDWTGMTPPEILSTIEDMGKDGVSPVKMVAHPRDGILGYFDQYGWNPYTGEVQTPLTALTNQILAEPNFTLEFDALELLNGKRFDFIRTPTQPELDAYAASGDLTVYDMVSRTVEEQEALMQGTYTLGYGQLGQIDDWFTLLNLGHRLVALANSDTHGKFSVEAGCPHNYVQVDIDDPQSIDAFQIAEAVKAGRVVASYGPFVRFWVDDAANGPGSTVSVTDGSATIHVEVEAPEWMAVDRVEIYRNGALVRELVDLDTSGPLRVATDVEIPVEEDSWFVAVAIGEGSLAPVYSPVEMPPVELQDVVTEALSEVPAIGSLLSSGVPIPLTGDVLPYALTNPVWVDVDGGDWTPPGIPAWLVEPVEPE